MKKIAYIELDTHAEIAQNFMELMQDSNKFDVDFYFSDKILKILECLEGKNIHRTSPKKIVSQLSKKKYDLVIIGTAHRYFNIFLKICKGFNTAVICHNLNFTKISKRNLFLNTFKADRIYRLKLLLKEGLLSAPKMYRNSKLLVLDDAFQNENFKYLPLFFNINFEAEKKSITKVVIPGTVSQKRRDYQHIFEKIKSMETAAHLRFIFLGKAANEELCQLQNLRNQTSKKISVEFFTEKVPQKTFDEKMKGAQLLWCPIQRETKFFSQKEIYGETKMSGNIGDAIKYGKLAIFPKDFVSKKPFLLPENENLVSQISTLERIQYDFSANFSRTKVQKEAEAVLYSLL